MEQGPIIEEGQARGVLDPGAGGAGRAPPAAAPAAAAAERRRRRRDSAVRSVGVAAVSGCWSEEAGAAAELELPCEVAHRSASAASAACESGIAWIWFL